MSSRAITESTAHDEVILLLPWYVNGTLGSRQKSLVGEHVRSCIACRRELENEVRTLDAFHHASPLDQSVRAGFERLQSRIDARSAPHLGGPVTGVAGQAWMRVTGVARTIAGARLQTALIALPLIATAVVLGMTRIPGLQLSNSGYADTGTALAADGYQTLSSRTTGVASPDDVQLIFTRGTSTDTIDGLLESVPAKIVDGPNSAGIYTVRLLGLSAESDRQAAILGLRSRQEVLFAEPAQPMSISSPYEAQAK